MLRSRMPILEGDVIETLLHMSEGPTLDFKRDQYPISGASDEQKGEFVKDILAFANAWKTSDAHILVGVADQAGGRASIVGVSQHYDDATLQQLVNSKTNAPVTFEYIPTTVEGKRVGVIRIAQQQQRPLFLKKDFGRLKRNEVYIRRGSSTVTADPTEVAQMGAAATAAAQEPAVSLELGDPRTHIVHGSSAAVTSRVLRRRPPPGPAPPELEALVGPITGQSARMKSLHMPNVFFQGPTKKERDAYLQECSRGWGSSSTMKEVS